MQREGAQEKKILGEIIANQYNQKVELVQRLLIIHGFSAGRPDGKLGPRTRDAIASFQEAQGLPVSRFVDRATWKALNIFTESGLVLDGQVNIYAIQKKLFSLGFDPGKIDGKMGPDTRNAVMEFQEKNNLKVDGRIGPETLGAINRIKNIDKLKKGNL